MKSATTSVRQQVELCIGKTGTLVGPLVYVRQGRRENSAMAYVESWLANPERFNISADLYLGLGYQTHKAASPHDSVFHGAIADTAPDAWGSGSLPVTTPGAARRTRALPHSPRWTTSWRWMILVVSVLCVCAMATGGI